jgi:hypothetical protein
MRFNLRKIIAALGVFTLILSMVSSSALAASASASVSSSSVNVGGTVTVTVTFKNANIGAVQGSFSYDSSSLKYTGGSNTGNGTIAAVAGSQGASSLTATMTFKALKSGSHKVSISGSEILDFDMNSLGSASTSATITVKAPAKSSSSSSTSSSSSSGSSSNTSSTNKTPAPAPEPEPEPEPEPDPMEKAVEVKIGEETKYLWPELLKVKLPEGFEKGKGVYGEDEIEVASSKDENTDIVLAYFTDKNGEKGSFYIFDEEKQEFYPRVNLNAKSSYTILRLNDAQEIPQGYVEAEFEIDGNKVEAWMLESGKSEDFVLLYVMNEEGEKGFYTYDKEEGTMQRFTDRVVEVEVLIEPEPMGVFEKIFGDPLLASIFGGLGLVAAGLTAGLVKLGKNSKM